MESFSAPISEESLKNFMPDGPDLLESWNVRKKAWLMASQIGTISAYETPIFKRFVKWPLIISNVLFLVLVYEMFVFLIDAAIVSADWLTIVLLIPTAIFLYLIASITKKNANRIMMRERLWQFGRTKFDTWDEFSDWIGRTDPNELDFICGEPDDSWEPDLFMGGATPIAK